MKMKFFVCALMLIPSVLTSTAEAGWFKRKKKAKADTTEVKSGYDKLIGDDVLTSEGVFKVHQDKKDFYFEIHDSLMGRDFLIVNKLQKVQAHLNEAGVNKAVNYENNLVRFEFDSLSRALLVRQVLPMPLSPSGDAISRSVKENFISPLIASLKLEARSNDSLSYVVKVNDLYTGKSKVFNNVFDNIGLGTSAISELSRIKSAKAYEDNVMVRSELTTKVTEGQSSVNVTVEVSSSMVLLPEVPMQGRFDTNKLGYFGTPVKFFDDKQQQTESRQFITRWRLEPREEDRERYLAGELVEPKKPIVFYIDQSTPEQWRDYMRVGVEDWSVAFERAGFKNAIKAIQMTDSIEVDADDMSYSVINYIASDKVNAMGPSIIDPRSGEILEADIIWWHNVISMIQKWITVQTGAVNPDARQLIIPDSIMGDAMRFVACHEVGHSLGLRHNMMGSWAYPTDSLRSKSFTDKAKSTSSSIMDYARFNYVAQPGDGVTNLSPNIGPYDIYAIEYGYRWFGDHQGHAERDDLKALLERYTGREYAFGDAQDSRDAVDPRAQSEDLGDDPVKSSNYGIANLKRIMPEVVAWATTTEASKDSYFEAGRLVMNIINQWNNYLYHALAQVGGIYYEDAVPGDGLKAYTYVEKEKQKESVKFLIDNVFTHQEWLFDAEVYDYIYPVKNSPMGMYESSPSTFEKTAHSYLFWDLLNNNRLVRMLEAEAKLGPKQSYTVIDLMDDLHRHVFKKTISGQALNVKDRELQKNFVDALILAVSESSTNKDARRLMDDNHYIFDSAEAQDMHICSRCVSGHSHERHSTKTTNFYGTQANRISDAISAKRGQLLRIVDQVKPLSNSADVATRYHYKDILLRINTALGL